MNAIIFNLLFLLKEKRFIHEPIGAPGTIPVLIGFIIITGIVIYFKIESDSKKDYKANKLVEKRQIKNKNMVVNVVSNTHGEFTGMHVKDEMKRIHNKYLDEFSIWMH